MVLKFFAGLIVFLFVVTVKAQDTASTATTYKIRQIMLDQNLVVAETSNANEVLKPGKIFLVTFSTGKQCSLTMKEKSSSLVILSTTSCSMAQEITKASPIEASLIDVAMPAPIVVIDKPTAEPAQTPAPVANESPRLGASSVFKKVGFFVHYSTANEMNFLNAYATTASGGGPLEIKFGMDTAGGIGMTFADMPTQNWGARTSFFFETLRDIKTVTLKGAGGTATGIITGTPPKVSFLVLEGSMVYRWETFYMPFGINYSIPTITDLNGSTIDYSGTVGIYIGGGILTSDRTSVDFFIRGLGMRLKEVSGTTTVDYGMGTLTGFGVGYNFWF